MIEFRDLTVRYEGSETDAVKRASFTLADGTFTGLIGESGSGKSTIVASALRILPRGTSVSGNIVLDGNDILTLGDEELRAVRWTKEALVPQGAMNSFTPVLTIGHHITETILAHLPDAGADMDEKVDGLLNEVGLDASVKNKYPHELSGGQKQRAAIALALSCSPSLLFADEPTTALDVVTQAGVLKLLAKLQADKSLTVLLVTHDLPLAASVCGRLIVMKDGVIVESGTPREIITNPKHEHTKALVRAMF